MDRRTFLGTSAALSVLATLPQSQLLAATQQPHLKLLILGGTRFIGPHVVELARSRGHKVTLFNRGKTNVGRVTGVEVLQGDRNGQLQALEGRKWDAVLDTSAFVPRIVKLSAELLKDSVSHYVYVSSISAYASFATANDENSPVGKLADESIEKVDENTYGPLKALCEQAAERTMPGRVTTLRPGYIVGPDDNSDRFTYWPARVARGGEVLAPNTPQDEIQVIDVRDLAAFTVLCIERRVLGTFNLVSPPKTFTMGALMNDCIAAAKSDARVTWVPAEFLEAHGVVDGDLPIWSHATGENAGFALTSAQRALAAGLKIRPLGETVRDTLAWQLARPPEQQARMQAGFSTERERQLLEAWHESQKKS
jgi:2'-hydroxyisoflavone reductase